MPVSSRLPAVFLAHGSPMLAVERDDFTESLRRFGESLPRPRAMAIVSAHWESASAIRVTGGDHPAMIYDFGGFPEEIHEVRYPAPGAPELAADLVKRLAAADLRATLDPHRGIDHGAWVPARHVFPAAELPLVEVSLPVPRTPADLLRLGSCLASLRDAGVLLIGSGGIVHNLRRVRMDLKQAPVDAWAAEFDDWVR